MNWNICKYVNGGGDYCKEKNKYGYYCSKHKRFHLLNNETDIIEGNFTNNISDYLLKDLKYYYKKNINQVLGNHNKFYFFNEISKRLLNPKKYDIYKIIKIQRTIKIYLDNLYKKCNNNEDFYTFDELNTIHKKYLFIYKDLKGFYWGFDIRSLYKLIEINKLNPYTTEPFPDYTIELIKNRMNLLLKRNSYENLEEIVIKDREDKIKKNIVDLFSDIEINGWTCLVEWFLKLSIRRLKELYRQLEDLWNYRLREHIDTKKRLAPPDGKLFNTPIINLSDYQNTQDMQELLLHDILKFKSINDLGDKKLGYMYFLICLSYVSPECYLAHQQWVSAINP
jgi:hypothetical protein